MEKPAVDSCMLDQRILAELLYARVRASVDLCQLVVIESDLDESIRRAMTTTEATAADQVLGEMMSSVDAAPRSLAWSYVETAWRRLESDWHAMRVQLGTADEP